MDWQSKRVLVTGGAGFIGSHLSAKLLELGADVTVLDDCSAGDSAKVPSGANFIEGCITDPATRSSALEGVDAVFHCAAELRIFQSRQVSQCEAQFLYPPAVL